jgi:hypothetical protein
MSTDQELYQEWLNRAPAKKGVLPNQALSDDITSDEALFEEWKGSGAAPDVKTDIPEEIAPQSSIMAEAEKLPEIAKKRFFEDIGTTAALLFSADDETKIDIIKERYNLTDKNVRRDEKTGVTIIDFPDGKSQVLNKPGASFQDMINFAGEAAAQIPGLVATAAIPGGWLAKAAYETLGGGLTEYGLQKGAQALGGKQPIKPIDIALAGAVGGAGSLVESGVKGLGARQLRKRTGIGDREDYTAFPESVERSKQITEALKPYGDVDTFRPQQTGYIKDIMRGRYAAMMSEEAQRRLMKQNTQVKKLTDNFIQSISPANTYPEASGRIRGVARKMIKNLETERSKVAEKLYNEAIEQPGKFVMPDTIRTINDILESYPETGRPNQIKSLRSMLMTRTKSGEAPAGLTLKQLHKIKAFRLEDYIKKADPKNRIELNKIKDSLLSEIEKVSPKYKEAREAYAELSAPIDQINQSIIGDIAKLKDKQLKTLQNMIANPNDYQVSPREIDRIRRAFKSEDPDAWNAYVGSIFDNKIMSKMKSLGEEEEFLVENIPAQIERALIGRGGKEKNLMLSLLDGEQKKNFTYLLEGLKRWKQMRPGGSQTALLEEIKKEAKGFGRIARKVIQATQPREAAIRAAETVSSANYVKSMTKTLLDPTPIWAMRAKDARKLGLNTKTGRDKFFDLMKDIFTMTAKSTAQAARPRESR